VVKRKCLTQPQETALQRHEPNKSLHPNAKAQKAKAKAKAMTQARVNVELKAKGAAEAETKLGLRIAHKAGVLQTARKGRRLRITIVLLSNRFNPLMWSLRRCSPPCLKKWISKNMNMTILIREPGCILT
jgi:regulator of protease activity HflC (stomatin/prohibitin superfamily)